MKRFAIAVFAALAGGAAQAQTVDVRFCPEAVARPYPLDSLRGVQSLLLQDVGILNRSGAPAEIASVTVELRRNGETFDRRVFAGAALAGVARTGPAIKAQGFLDLLPGQFCDGRLLGNAAFATGPTLAPNEALLLFQQPFAWKGVRDEARVIVLGPGDKPLGQASVRLDGSVSKTAFRWPLKSGVWLTGAGASFHTSHRWAVPEEFALDIFQLGPDGRSFRTDGARHTDFHGYNAEVVAAADGTVAQIVTGGVEHPPQLRKPGEAMSAYLGRVGEQQAKNLAGGLVGVMGDAVILDHGSGEYSVYAHLRPGSIAVRAGQAVKAGQTLGRLGSSGNSTEPHLHFQVCDKPAALSCAGLVPNFPNLDILNSDGPRPLQSGDLVRAGP